MNMHNIIFSKIIIIGKLLFTKNMNLASDLVYFHIKYYLTVEEVLLNLASKSPQYKPGHGDCLPTSFLIFGKIFYSSSD
jgi:hypothetical protein